MLRYEGSKMENRLKQELEELKKEALNCTKCGLCATRKNVVFGFGNDETELMFIGEGPGADEDTQGEPFLGKARTTYG